eukprot:CFRG3933T1
MESLINIVSPVYTDFSNYWEYVPRTLYSQFMAQNFDSFQDFVEPALQSAKDEFKYTYDDLIRLMAFAGSIFLVRLILHNTVFKGMARILGLNQQDKEKFPESMWNITFYSMTFAYMYYLMNVTGRHEYLTDMHSWYRPLSKQAFNELWWLYMVELGYYLSALVMDVVFNSDKDDYLMLTLHHFATISLIGFSYSLNLLPVGLTVMYCHDLNDVLLDLAKVFNYLGRREGASLTSVFQFLSNCTFLCFVYSWVHYRFWLFGSKVLLGTGYFYHTDTPGHLHLTFNFLLHLLLTLHYIWFLLILKVVKKVLLGQAKDDIREKSIRRRSSFANQFHNEQKGMGSLTTLIQDVKKIQ